MTKIKIDDEYIKKTYGRTYSSVLYMDKDNNTIQYDREKIIIYKDGNIFCKKCKRLLSCDNSETETFECECGYEEGYESSMSFLEFISVDDVIENVKIFERYK